MEVRAAMAPQDNLEGMSFPRLTALAAARGVDVSDLGEKAELVAALGAAAWREAALTAALKCRPADATARAAGRSAAHAAAHAAFLRRRRGEASSDEDDTTAVVAAAPAAAEAAASVPPKIQEAVAEALEAHAVAEYCEQEEEATQAEIRDVRRAMQRRRGDEAALAASAAQIAATRFGRRKSEEV